MNKEKKVTNFLYVSSLTSAILSGYNLINFNFVDSISYLTLSNGLYQVGKSIEVSKKEYIKNLKLYEASTKLGSFSCIFLIDNPYVIEEVITYLFIGGTMYLYSEIYRHENKQL